MFTNNAKAVDVAKSAIENGYDGLNQEVIYETMLDFGYQGGPMVVEGTQETNKDVWEVELEADAILSNEINEINTNSF